MSNLPKRALLLAAITSIVIGLTVFPAKAQNASVDEIIVTSAYEKPNTSALKMPVPLIDVPQSLSIIDRDTILRRGFAELGDIVRYTPGLNTSQGEGHRDSIVFRGVRSTADFFLDGVRDDVQYYRPLYNLEQVEILRGPNALLFGRGGTGGAVNRVTKKAKIGAESNRLDASIDSFGAYTLAADSNMAIGDNAALRINAFIETLENDRDFYDGDRMGLNPTLRTALSAQTVLDVSLELMDHERFIDRGIPTDRTTGAPVDSLRDIVFGSPTDNTTELEATVLRGTINHKFSDTMSGVFNLHYGDYEKIYQNLYADGYNATAETVTLKGYRDPTERTHMVLNGHIVNQFSTAGMGHTLLIGGEYIDTQSDNHRFNPTLTAGGTSSKSADFSIANPLVLSTNATDEAVTLSFDEDLKTSTETEITVTSLLVQDQIAVSENLQVLLGARMDNFDITVKDIDNASQESRKDDEVSTRFGLIYKPQSNMSLYASMSESFLPRSGEQYKALSAEKARLDPDMFENTEFGVKWDISQALSLTASMFDNEQETAVEDGTGSAYIQGLTVDGYELEINGRLTEKTTIALGYTALDGETKDGDTPRELPETAYSVYIERQANERLSYGIGATYQDESLVKDGSTAFMPDYTRIDASLSYIMSNDMTLRVNIENLTDEEYYPHAHGTDQVSVGDPMNAKLSLTRNF
jgi:catecholate siderophore receptor